MRDKNIYTELHRYLNYQCNTNQRSEVEAWINISDKNKSYYNQINNIWCQGANLNTMCFDYITPLANAKHNITEEQKSETITNNLIDPRLKQQKHFC